MKAKTIKKVLRAKIKEWLDTIDDPILKTQMQGSVIVTGGCIASMLLGEKINDFDVYFSNHHVTKIVADYYVKKFGDPQKRKGVQCAITVQDEGGRVKIVVKSAGVASEDGSDKPYEYFEARPEGEAGEYVEDIMDEPGAVQEAYDEASELAQETTADEAEDGRPKYRPVFLSTNAITLSNRIQVVLRFDGDADALHNNFDYAHCTNYWQSWNDELVLRPVAMECLLAKELRYVGSKYPICSVIRLRKFLRRGWQINAGQILKMVWQISELDLKDYNVLQDQLTGVDAAYFMQLVSLLKEKHPEKVNAAYLVEIIDRLF